MAQSKVSPQSLAAGWAELESLDVLDPNKWDAVEAASRVRGALLQEAGVSPPDTREFARENVLRARTHAVAALKAANMNAGSLGAEIDPRFIAAVSRELMPSAGASADRVGETARNLQGQVPTLPNLETLAQEMPDRQVSMMKASGESLLASFTADHAANLARAASSASEALRMTWVAATVTTEPFVGARLLRGDKAKLKAAGLTPQQIQWVRLEVRKGRSMTASETAVRTVYWSSPFGVNRSALVGLATNIVAMLSAMSAYYAGHAAGPTEPMSAANFADAGRAELRSQADWLLERLIATPERGESWQFGGG